MLRCALFVILVFSFNPRFFRLDAVLDVMEQSSSYKDLRRALDMLSILPKTTGRGSKAMQTWADDWLIRVLHHCQFDSEDVVAMTIKVAFRVGFVNIEDT